MKRLLILAMLSTLFLGSSRSSAAEPRDFGGIARYAQANVTDRELPPERRRVVFLGNSITDFWINIHPDFWTENPYIDRGISGQTSYQMLLRLREDVLKLQPEAMVLNCGINDIAENTGPYDEEVTMGNIMSIVELAKANGIKVIMTSVLPADRFFWSPDIENITDKVASLNARIRDYARLQGLPYVDYYSAMVLPDSSGAINPAYSTDGVHPVLQGYLVMEPLVKAAIDETLSPTEP